MTVLSPNISVDLQYWFNKFLFTTKLNKNQVPYSNEINDSVSINDRSFIRLLFDDNWPNDYLSFDYMFKRDTLSSCHSASITRRIAIYPNPNIYFCVSGGDINLFNLKSDDLLMLNKLLEYRISDSTAAEDILIDSTAEYDTVLSSLIHSYLDFKINNNVDFFNTMIPISDSLLTCFYEIYVTEKMFNYISDTDYL